MKKICIYSDEAYPDYDFQDYDESSPVHISSCVIEVSDELYEFFKSARELSEAYKMLLEKLEKDFYAQIKVGVNK